jgi:hypothetical protein
MYTTINENGVLNNYANEPKIYYATYPNKQQQIRYAFGGAVATLFVAVTVLVGLGVS